MMPTDAQIDLYWLPARAMLRAGRTGIRSDLLILVGAEELPADCVCLVEIASAHRAPRCVFFGRLPETRQAQIIAIGDAPPPFTAKVFVFAPGASGWEAPVRVTFREPSSRNAGTILLTTCVFDFDRARQQISRA